VKYLRWLIEDVLRIDGRALVSEDEAGFVSRLRLQKAAYLLKRMGVEPFTKYSFTIYLRGPYSPELAKEYYGEVGEEKEKPGITAEKLELLKWFVEHDEKWLEIASSILSILEDYPDISYDELFSLLRMSKPWITREKLDEIYRELEERSLVGKQTVLVS